METDLRAYLACMPAPPNENEGQSNCLDLALVRLGPPARRRPSNPALRSSGNSGRFGAAQPVRVGDLDLSPRGWKPLDAHLGASQRVCAGVLIRLSGWRPRHRATTGGTSRCTWTSAA